MPTSGWKTVSLRKRESKWLLAVRVGQRGKCGQGTWNPRITGELTLILRTIGPPKSFKQMCFVLNCLLFFVEGMDGWTDEWVDGWMDDG